MQVVLTRMYPPSFPTHPHFPKELPCFPVNLPPPSINVPSLDISVVAPIYNEVESVGRLLEAIAAVMDETEWSYEIILVDDGSTDGTRDRLRELVQDYPQLKVIFLRRNYGQTPAMAAGFQEANAAVIVTLDGDLQNDPKDIPNLIAILDQGYDLVSGWRKKPPR